MAMIAACIVILSSCVTTIDGYSNRLDKQRSVDNYVQLGTAYLQQNNRDAARRNFEKALSIKSNSSPANNGMALLYQLNGEFDLAEKHYLKAIRADADYTQARNSYGIFLYQQQRYQEAYDTFAVDASVELTTVYGGKYPWLR